MHVVWLPPSNVSYIMQIRDLSPVKDLDHLYDTDHLSDVWPCVSVAIPLGLEEMSPRQLKPSNADINLKSVTQGDFPGIIVCVPRLPRMGKEATTTTMIQEMNATRSPKRNSRVWSRGRQYECL